MAESLTAIEAWLARYAPVSHATLRPGLSEAQLQNLELRYRFPLNPDLRTLLSWHDGSQNSNGLDIWTDYLFETSEEMFSRSRFPDPLWDRHWVPFASDTGINTLVVDHTTGEGRILLHDGSSGIHPDWAWPNLRNLVAKTAHALTFSSPLDGRHGRALDGRLRWVSRE
ncbi:SMI1/KNR4 family protein [Actinoplanes sp. NPDC051470]|uniref:SMI1/KNR4 family protein n=1 Tax=Actinoplanes sp. NPDC051470 TaxID=3157224 RepID=UPI00342A4724